MCNRKKNKVEAEPKELIRSYIASDDIDNLISIFNKDKSLFSSSLFKYAVRNNSSKCLDFLVVNSYYTEKLSNKCIFTHSGNFISVETMKFLSEIPFYDMRRNGEFVIHKLIRSGRLHLISDYVRFMFDHHPDIISILVDAFKRYGIKKSYGDTFIRTLTIENILQ